MCGVRSRIYILCLISSPVPPSLLLKNRYKVLIQSDGSPHTEKTVKANQPLVFNPKFKSSQRRIKVPLLVAKGGADKERKGNIETVEVERRHGT